MDRRDHDRIIEAGKKNHTLRRLYEDHQRFEDELARLGRQVYLTEEERVREKALKQQKLRGVDRMLRMVKQIST